MVPGSLATWRGPASTSLRSTARTAKPAAAPASPTLYAVSAARAALSGSATGLPKSRTGNVEAIRVLMVARRSAIDERITTLNQLRHICMTAEEPIRQRFAGLTPARLIRETAALRPRRTDPVRHATLHAIRSLGQRARFLQLETRELDATLKPLITATAPGLLGVSGSASRRRRGSWSRPGTTRSAFAPRRRGPTCVASPRSRRRRARRSVIASTAAVTAKPTARSIGW